MDFGRMPEGRLKTTCHACNRQFMVNKVDGLNCRREKTYDVNGWQVETSACSGMVYDLEDLVGLIRSGMVNRETKVRPPKEKKGLPAGEVPQLEKAFEQWDQRNPNR